MTRIRIKRAKPRDLATGKRFQAVTENNLGRVVNRAPATRTVAKAVQTARSLAYQSTAASADGSPPWQGGGGGGGGSPGGRNLVSY